MKIKYQILCLLLFVTISILSQTKSDSLIILNGYSYKLKIVSDINKNNSKVNLYSSVNNDLIFTDTIEYNRYFKINKYDYNNDGYEDLSIVINDDSIRITGLYLFDNIKKEPKRIVWPNIIDKNYIYKLTKDYFFSVSPGLNFSKGEHFDKKTCGLQYLKSYLYRLCKTGDIEILGEVDNDQSSKSDSVILNLYEGGKIIKTIQQNGNYFKYIDFESECKKYWIDNLYLIK